jgi:hypothetical protein
VACPAWCLEMGLKIHPAFYVICIAIVIAVLAGDLALRRTRALPSAASFCTAQLAILVTYLVFAGLLFGPALLMVLWVPISLALLFAYLALGTAQATAIAAGLEERGIAGWRAWPIALLLAYLPVIGSSLAVYGATLGWSWSIRKALIRFFGPLVAILAPVLVFFAEATTHRM